MRYRFCCMDWNYDKDDGVERAIETLMINARIYQCEAIVALHMYVNINTAVFYARWIRRRILFAYINRVYHYMRNFLYNRHCQ